MLRFLSKLKRKKSSAMAEEPSTPGTNQPLSDEEIQAVSATPPPLSPEHIAMFMEAYDCAKNNYQWNKVTSAISNHPEWLVRIPPGRRWTMLHQIVYCGNVPHLNEVLSFEVSNQEFRLLCKSLDDKTVREVAMERAHVNPQMLRHIERLVAIDQVLNNARDGKWELVRQFLRQQADIVNEKPPYRRYYLAHYLASTGQLDMFKELSNICPFKLDVIADHKTINRVARDNNHIEFAEHIERLCPNINEISENTEPDTTADPTQSNATSEPYFSQGFYDDPGIMIFSLNSNPFGSLLLTSNGSSLPTNNHDHFYATHSLIQGQNPTTMHSNQTSTNGDAEQENDKKSKVNIPPPMTDEEQVEYEKTVTDNIKKFSADNLLSNAMTCCITKGILRDPVVAADGFTYEREAIVNWFKHSNRSPMTNQELDNQELKPNHAIKSILQSLAEPNKTEKKHHGKKSKLNGDDTK